MKLLKFKMKIKIKGPLSDLNLGLKISVSALNPSPHTVWQAVFLILGQKSNPLMDFHCLICQSIWTMQKSWFKILHGLNEKSMLLSIFQIPSCSIPLSLLKSPLSCWFQLARFLSYWESSGQVNTPYSKLILIQLTNIYLIKILHQDFTQKIDFIK